MIWPVQDPVSGLSTPEFVNIIKIEQNLIFRYVAFEHGSETVRAIYAASGVESCYINSSLCKVACTLDSALVTATMFDQGNVIPIGQVRWEG